jgi:hypothetical protein
MSEIFSKSKILSAYNAIKSKKSQDRNKSLPVGLDGTRVDVFERNLDFSISEIYRKLLVQNGEIPYKFAPLLRIERTKAQGGLRELFIPRLRDQIVLRLLHDELKNLAELKGIDLKQKSPYSFVTKFHKELKQHDDPVILKTDISRFYDSVPRNEALKICKKIGLREELYDLLQNWSSQLKFKNGNLGFSTINHEFFGLPQGLSISSLLAELYVKPIDYAFFGDDGYFRYVDDILIICNDKQEAIDKLEQLKEQANQLQLQLAPNKTEIVKISQGIEWLGLWHFPDRIAIHPDKLIRALKPISSLQKECIQEIAEATSLHEKELSVNKLIRKIYAYTRGINNIRIKWYALCEDKGQWKKMDSNMHRSIDSCIRKAGLSRANFGNLPSIHAQVCSYKKIKESQ